MTQPKPRLGVSAFDTGFEGPVRTRCETDRLIGPTQSLKYPGSSSQIHNPPQLSVSLYALDGLSPVIYFGNIPIKNQSRVVQ